MKNNFWLSVTVVIGFLFAIIIVCVTIFQIKKLEFAHQEALANKNLVKLLLVQEDSSVSKISGWENFMSTLKKVAIELCPSFMAKLFGF